MLTGCNTEFLSVDFEHISLELDTITAIDVFSNYTNYFFTVKLCVNFFLLHCIAMFPEFILDQRDVSAKSIIGSIVIAVKWKQSY